MGILVSSNAVWHIYISYRSSYMKIWWELVKSDRHRDGWYGRSKHFSHKSSQAAALYDLSPIVIKKRCQPVRCWSIRWNQTYISISGWATPLLSLVIFCRQNALTTVFCNPSFVHTPYFSPYSLVIRPSVEKAQRRPREGPWDFGLWARLCGTPALHVEAPV